MVRSNKNLHLIAAASYETLGFQVSSFAIAGHPVRSAGRSNVFQVEVRDSKHPMGVVFAWWTSQSGGDPNDSMMNVTLDCPWAFKVTSVISGSFATNLLLFIQEIDAREGGWQDARVLKTPDEDFVISCFECYQREISVEVSLDSAWDDPEWTVQLRFNVDREKWHDFAIQFEQFLSEGRRHGT